MVDKKKRFQEICKKIKNVEIQGASEIARAALQAYLLMPTKAAKRKLLSLRPTEPLLRKVLQLIDEMSAKAILEHFEYVQEQINKHVASLLRNNAVVFTHCHSNTLVKALVHAKKHGKRFSVVNTETRPLYQGRKTAMELAKAGIHVEHYVDAGFALALEKASIVMLGADALLPDAVINKIGSGVVAELAYARGLPLYVVADSWKFTTATSIEERPSTEVWKIHKRNIMVKNPAFEKIPVKYVKAVVSELGVLSYNKFLRKVKG